MPTMQERMRDAERCEQAAMRLPAEQHDARIKACRAIVLKLHDDADACVGDDGQVIVSDDGTLDGEVLGESKTAVAAWMIASSRVEDVLQERQNRIDTGSVCRLCGRYMPMRHVDSASVSPPDDGPRVCGDCGDIRIWG